MLQLDHLVIVAPTLEVGSDYVEARLGVRPWYGGEHRELGTHNMLLRIGDDLFLEVIATNPKSAHVGPRVFGITEYWPEVSWPTEGCLTTWVGRTLDLRQMHSIHHRMMGEIKSVTRGTRHWQMAIPADGSLPHNGFIPTAVQYEPNMIPAKHMPENGLQLRELRIEHQQAMMLQEVYDEWKVQGTIKIVTSERSRLTALIETPKGVVELS